jgi:hypothetical protein
MRQVNLQVSSIPRHSNPVNFLLNLFTEMV